MAESRMMQEGEGDRITIEDIRAIAGDIDDIDAAAIIATGGDARRTRGGVFLCARRRRSDGPRGAAAGRCRGGHL